MSKHLKITIEGVPSSGKTTVALIIESALTMAGFGVNNEDLDSKNIVDYHTLALTQISRVEVLCRQKLNIDIEIKQLLKQ